MAALPSAVGNFEREAWLLATLVAMWVRPAEAGTGDIVTRVECPALSADVRAELEARARVDLTLRAAGGGELAVICRELDARLVWRPRAGGDFERVVPVSATPSVLVDSLLVAVAEVAEDAAAAGARNPTEGANGSRAERVAQSLEDSQASKRPGAGESGADRTSESRSAGGQPFALAALVGGQLALFGGGAGIAGPTIGIGVGLPAGFVGSVSAEYGWGFGSGNAVSLHSAAANVFLSYRFGKSRVFEVGAGGSAGAIFASAASGYTPDGESQSYFAAIVRARSALTTGRFRFAAGPELRLETPRSVDLDGKKIWEMPALAVGVGLEVAAGIRGSLE